MVYGQESYHQPDNDNILTSVDMLEDDTMLDVEKVTQNFKGIFRQECIDNVEQEQQILQKGLRKMNVKMLDITSLEEKLGALEMFSGHIEIPG